MRVTGRVTERDGRPQRGREPPAPGRRRGRGRGPAAAQPPRPGRAVRLRPAPGRRGGRPRPAAGCWTRSPATTTWRAPGARCRAPAPATTPTWAGWSSTPSASARWCRRSPTWHPRLDSDLLLAAALVHDIGHARAFRLGATFELTDEGRLLGHVAIGHEIVGDAARARGPAAGAAGGAAARHRLAPRAAARAGAGRGEPRGARAVAGQPARDGGQGAPGGARARRGWPWRSAARASTHGRDAGPSSSRHDRPRG